MGWERLCERGITIMIIMINQNTQEVFERYLITTRQNKVQISATVTFDTATYERKKQDVKQQI